MKITKNAQHEYEINDINENSGYIKWYDRAETAINRIICVVLSYGGLLAFLYSPAFDAMKNSLKVPKENMQYIFFFLCLLAIFIFLMPLLWRIIQLAIVSNGKLNESCVLKLRGSVTCIYNEKLTRERAFISLIVPCVMFVLLFVLLTILTDGVLKTFFVLMVYRTIIYATDDFGALWCLLKKVGKNDIIFGEYKKQGSDY